MIAKYYLICVIIHLYDGYLTPARYYHTTVSRDATFAYQSVVKHESSLSVIIKQISSGSLTAKSL